MYAPLCPQSHFLITGGQSHYEWTQRSACNAAPCLVPPPPCFRYLNKEARACYWYHLLLQFSGLLRFKPGKVPGRRFMEDYVPVEEYLERVIKPYNKGRIWDKYFVHFSP